MEKNIADKSWDSAIKWIGKAQHMIEKNLVRECNGVVRHPEQRDTRTTRKIDPSSTTLYNRCHIKQIFSSILCLLLLFGCSSREQTTKSSERIIFFGDSITELGIKPNGYVSLVHDSLKTIGYHYDVIGAGVSGNKINDLLDRVEKDVIAKKPSIVVVYIGINDVWHFAFASRGLTGTPKNKFEEGLKNLILQIQSNGAKVILCTPSVIGEKNDGSNPNDILLDEYSAISRKIAAETGSTLCDLRKEFLSYLHHYNLSNAEQGILTYDGVHLNDTGNHFVAEQIVKTLDGLGLFFPQR